MLFIIKSLVVVVADIGTLLLIFVPKFYMEHREGEAGMVAASEQLRDYAAKRWDKGNGTGTGTQNGTQNGTSAGAGGGKASGTGTGIAYTTTALNIKTQTGASLAANLGEPVAQATAYAPPEEPGAAAAAYPEASIVQIGQSDSAIPVAPPGPPAAAPAAAAPPPRTAVPKDQSILYGTHKALAPRPAVESQRAGGFWGRQAPGEAKRHSNRDEASS